MAQPAAALKWIERITSKTMTKLEERYASISNDISEGIDNGESRKVLRETVKYYASRYCVAASNLATAESNLTCIASLIETARIFLPKSTPTEAQAGAVLTAEGAFETLIDRVGSGRVDGSLGTLAATPFTDDAGGHWKPIAESSIQTVRKLGKKSGENFRNAVEKSNRRIANLNLKERDSLERDARARVAGGGKPSAAQKAS